MEITDRLTLLTPPDRERQALQIITECYCCIHRRPLREGFSKCVKADSTLTGISLLARVWVTSYPEKYVVTDKTRWCNNFKHIPIKAVDDIETSGVGKPE